VVYDQGADVSPPGVGWCSRAVGSSATDDQGMRSFEYVRSIESDEIVLSAEKAPLVASASEGRAVIAALSATSSRPVAQTESVDLIRSIRCRVCTTQA